jgi:hypothetical protein
LPFIAECGCALIQTALRRSGPLNCLLRMKRGGIEHRQRKLRLIPEKALGGALSPVALRRSLLHPALNASPFEPNVHLSVSGAGGHHHQILDFTLSHARSHHALAADLEANANADAPAEPAPAKAAATNAYTDTGAWRVARATVAVVRLLRGDTARDAGH